MPKVEMTPGTEEKLFHHDNWIERAFIRPIIDQTGSLDTDSFNAIADWLQIGIPATIATWGFIVIFYFIYKYQRKKSKRQGF